MRTRALKIASGIALVAAATVFSATGASAADERYVGHYQYAQDCGMAGQTAVTNSYYGSYWNSFACYGSSGPGYGYDLYMRHITPPQPVWKITDSMTVGYKATITECVNDGLYRTSNSSGYWNTFACPSSGATGYTLILQHGQYV